MSIAARISGCALLGVMQVWAQSVTFNTPVDWMTVDGEELKAQAIFDTAAIGGKTVTVRAEVFEDGRSRRGGSAKLTIDDASGDLNLGSISQTVLGGTDFMKLSWSVSGTDEDGEIGPIGVLRLEELPEYDDFRATKVEEGAGAGAVVKQAEASGYTAVGSAEAAFLWDSTRLLLAIKWGEDKSAAVTFAVDGKNGKYAFPAYSDRYIACHPSCDSLDVWHYRRSFTDDSLSYRREEWHNDIVCTKSDGVTVIEVPWYDMGMIPPFDGRRIGFSAFGSGEKEAALPESAQQDVPGTWGNLAFTVKP